MAPRLLLLLLLLCLLLSSLLFIQVPQYWGAAFLHAAAAVAGTTRGIGYSGVAALLWLPSCLYPCHADTAAAAAAV
jgi:hypothetical protein